MQKPPFFRGFFASGCFSKAVVSATQPPLLDSRGLRKGTAPTLANLDRMRDRSAAGKGTRRAGGEAIVRMTLTRAFFVDGGAGRTDDAARACPAKREPSRVWSAKSMPTARPAVFEGATSPERPPGGGAESLGRGGTQYDE
jgi:hypothetical protein